MSTTTMNSIPIDLVIEEIFSRLPSKSIARFSCLSKLWRSKLRRPYFTKCFLTMYWARPRLLFALDRSGKGELIFYSSPHQPQNPYDKPLSLDSHIKIPENTCVRFCGFTSGLFCFRHYMPISKEYEDTVHVICNPSTGQCVSLPKLRRDVESISFLGFDPIDKQFKVLSLARTDKKRYDPRILTLEAGKMSWRKIQCPLDRCPSPEGICINGVLYYSAILNDFHVIVCFDVRSEKFTFIDEGFNPGVIIQPPKLINYKGKLVGIRWKLVSGGGRCTPVACIRMRVLEDFEKHQWSEYVYTVPGNELADCYWFSFVGVTATGEIVLSMRSTASKQFYVYYFNPERNTLQPVDIQNFGGYDQELRVYTVLDHVEDLSGVHAFVDHHLADLNVTDAKNKRKTDTREDEDRPEKKKKKTTPIQERKRRSLEW